MKKVMLVFGTRPEAIKMCPVIVELKKRNIFEICICVTGQHKEMLKQVLDIFNVVPDYDLAIMKDNQTLFNITEEVLKGMEKVLIKENPNILLVHGDTSTAFVSALAAFYLNIPVGHIEAGLRSYNMHSPFPEEFNRCAISMISEYNFAPTKLSKDNLIREGKDEKSIYVTGNTVIDSLKMTISKNYFHPFLKWTEKKRMILLTAHRRENIGDTMKSMFCAIKRICDEYEDVCVIYPIHMNPSVRTIAYSILKNSERIHLIEPLDVVDFHNFINKSYLVLTDSGGIQEEASALAKPVLVMRDTTERPEGIIAGGLKLVGNSEESIYKNIKELLDNDRMYSQMVNSFNPYGDGNACRYIVDILENILE